MTRQLFIGIGVGVAVTALLMLVATNIFKNDAPVADSDNFKFLAQVALDAPSDEVVSVETTKADVKEREAEEAVATAASVFEPTPIPEPPPAPPAPAKIQPCAYLSANPVTNSPVILNEVAWMGNSKSSNHEWIELKNRTSAPADISHWQLIDKSAQIGIVIPEGTTVLAGGFWIAKRGSETLPGVSGLVYAGVLSNEDEGLKLFNASCVAQDQALADPRWGAGDASEKRTMERGSDWTWHTYYGAGTNGILGTPNKENSVPPPPVQVVQNNSPAPPPASPPPAAPPQTPPPPAPEPPPQSTTSFNHIVIAEVQITGGVGLTTNDYVKLYNPFTTPFNLKGYRLVKRTKTGTSDTSLKSWIDDAFIPAGGWYVWANSSFAALSPAADVTTSGSVAADNGVAIRQGSEDTGTIVDSVAWGEAANAFIEGGVFTANPVVNEKLKRKQWQDTNNNSADFEIGN